MRKSFNVAFLLASVGVFSGCSGICGRWESVGVQPAKAADYFNIAKATFNNDGTFDVTVQEGGTTRTSSGSYEYSWNKLKLHPSSGNYREYEAHLDMSGKKLVIEHEESDDREVEVRMQRVGCPADCSKSCCQKE